MSEKVHYNHCPVCGSDRFNEVLQVRDFTVSLETFPVAECATCTLRFTQDVPGAGAMAPYYKSEEYISHTDTAKGLVNRIYHLVRKRTTRKKRDMIRRITGLKKGKLLDVGSGTGAFISEMSGAGWDTRGLEPDADARLVAKKVFNVSLEDTGTFYELPENSFDAITMWHVLEHVHDLSRYVRHLGALLKGNGRLFVAVPNYNSKDAAVYGEYWAAYDVPRHLYHFSPAAMNILMEKNGLQVMRYEPMWYDSFYISLLSSKYKNGKTNWPGALFTGLRSNLLALGDPKKCSSVIYVIGRKEIKK